MKLSIVIPVYNEIDSLPPLFEALRQALDPLPNAWEVVLVDDGSNDGSAERLEAMAQEHPEQVRVVLFRRNFGQTAAMAAGIEHADGDVIILMDADLQNDPADIPMMLEKLDEGYDVICGWRADRQDRFFSRRLPSVIANRLIARVTGVNIHDYGCTLKAFRREIVTDFRLYGEMHRFIPPYAAQVGGKILEVPVRHHARKFGQSKYGIGRTVKVILDLCTVRLLTAYATKPMYLFGRIGLFFLALGLLPLVVLAVQPFVTGGFREVIPLIQTTVLLAGIGVHCILLGLVAELVMRTYFESQHKRPYVIKKVINGRQLPEYEIIADKAR